MNVRKAAGPDWHTWLCALSLCWTANWGLHGHFHSLAQSLAQALVPSIFKTATIMLVPALNDFRPVSLTPHYQKMNSSLPLWTPIGLPTAPTSQQRTPSPRHAALTHLDSPNSYVRMLFIGFKSAFNTIIPSTLISKLSHLGISTSHCNWIFDFRTNRLQFVKFGHLSSSTLTLNTGMPQGCMLSHLRYSLFTHDYAPV